MRPLLVALVAALGLILAGPALAGSGRRRVGALPARQQQPGRRRRRPDLADGDPARLQRAPRAALLVARPARPGRQDAAPGRRHGRSDRRPRPRGAGPALPTARTRSTGAHVSASDGHATSGFITFGVGAGVVRRPGHRRRRRRRRPPLRPQRACRHRRGRGQDRQLRRPDARPRDRPPGRALRPGRAARRSSRPPTRPGSC